MLCALIRTKIFGHQSIGDPAVRLAKNCLINYEIVTNICLPKRALYYRHFHTFEKDDFV